jgi:hypothetical protein
MHPPGPDMPMNQPNPSPLLKLPPRDADVTLLQHGTLAPPSRPQASVMEEGALTEDQPSLPDRAPIQRMLPVATGARVAMPAVQDSSPMNPAPQLDRAPVAAERRPLMPTPGANTNSTLAGQHNTIAPQYTIPPPGLLKPVRAPDNSPRPPVGASHEASDLIQTFQAGSDDAHPGMPYPAVAQKTIAPGSGLTIPPPGKLLRHGPPIQAAPPKPPLRAVQAVTPVAKAPPTAQQPALEPAVLPLQTERVVALVLEHRRRLKALDTWTRVLETAAVLSGVGALLVGVVGTLPMAGLLALTAIALAGQATTLRHVAHTSAQVSALLDALSGN